MTRGCPHGTAFGPLLWNMFQNDMVYHDCANPHLVRWRPSLVYAAGETHRTVESGLKTQGHLAPSWYKNNSLLPNPEKFQSLTVNPRNIKAENDDKTLYIDRIMTSEKTEQINLLGVYIDENLNFAGHISELCTRASQKVGILIHLWNL